MRHCHGDLHLGNIVLLEGRPVLFDCLEFDEALASTDTLYDLAFLLMDLLHQDLRPLAQRLLNGYLDATWDDGGIALLPLFLACRAAIRAKVLGLGVAGDGSSAGEVAEARGYLERALAYLDPPPARLVAVGGVSGTGKSTLARQLAPGLGPAPARRCCAATWCASACTLWRRAIGCRGRRTARKPRARFTTRWQGAPPCWSAPVMRRSWMRCFSIPPSAPDRRVAHEASVPFQGLWLSAPKDILAQRVAARRGDVSDATPDVLSSSWRPILAR